MLSRVSDIRGSDERRAAAAEVDARQSYVTDGLRLFRIVEPFAISETDARVFMSLEDCMTLEVESYSPEELYGMRLRPVRVASARTTNDCRERRA